MTKDSLEIKNQKPYQKIILKAILFITIILILFFTAAFTAFYFFKDDLSRSILLSLNNNINGKISFSDISFSPLKHFPDITLNLTNVKLMESADADSAAGPICKFEDVYLSVNLVDLFSSRINVPRVYIDDGYVNLIVYKDSSTNIGNFIGTQKPGSSPQIKEKKAAKISNRDSSANALTKKTHSAEKSSGEHKDGPAYKEIKKPKPPAQKTKNKKGKSFDIDLSIDRLSLSNIKIKAKNFLTANAFGISVRDFNSQISFGRKNVAADFLLDLTIDSLIIKDKLILSDKNLFLDSKVHLDKDSAFLRIDDSKLVFNEAYFNYKGTLDLKNEGNADLSITGEKEINESFLSLFLKEAVTKNLKRGSAEFNAEVKGKIFTQFPRVEMEFLLSDVFLLNPVTNKLIKNLNLKGSFSSGSKNDFSESVLLIDTLHADFPRGALRFSGKAENFVSPEIEISLFLDAEVTGLNDIFKIKFIDDIKGGIKIDQRFIGKYIPDKKKVITKLNNVDIILTDFRISIPRAVKFDKVNGTISRKNDSYFIKDLRVIYKDTDLLINGEISNLHYLIFGAPKDINAELIVKSPVFNLADFLFFDPNIKRDFPYRILNIDLSAAVKTSTEKLLKFKSFPEIDVDFKKLEASAENFLPRININSGKFTLSENILGFNMKFDKFKTEFLGGDLNFTGEYNTSRFQPYHIKTDAAFKGIMPSTLFISPSDTIPESLKGRLSGSCFIELQLPKDSLKLKFVSLNKGNLKYKFSKDTIYTRNLSFDFSNIYFNSKKDKNPFATLSTKGKFKAGGVSSSQFRVRDLYFDIIVSEGSYQIKSNKSTMFGENSKGISHFIMKPFAKIPSFSLKFSIDTFYAEKMLASYMEKEIITGPLSLTMDLNTKGSEWESIVKNLDGKINLSGNTLVFYGLDADNLLEKFKRSQNFNLVDVGGVLLAGPLGIVLTKGSDYASLLTLNQGESTKINQLVSNWTINNGLFNIEDAAFTTAENRIALKGSIDFAHDSLNLVTALLDEDGCSEFLQEISGNINSPVPGKVKVLKTILAPVTNLYNDIVGIDCEKFYNGSLKHPKK
ncbi:MAG: AsmA-like C-terminal region-containing protein, partial [Ignavibacteria bacterium]